MIEQRTIRVGEKVIGANDLLRLAKCVSDIASQSPKDGEREPPIYRIYSGEDKVFRTREYNELVTDVRLRDHPITAIDFQATGSRSEYELSIRLEQAVWNRSRVTITSPDAEWVAMLHDRMRELIATIPDQNAFVRKWGWLVVIALAVPLGYLLLRMWASWKYLFTSPTTESHTANPPFFQLLQENPAVAPVALWTVILAIACVYGWLPAWGLVAWCRQLWPSVEFQIGPLHKRVIAVRRRRLLVLLAPFLIPLLINLMASIMV